MHEDDPEHVVGGEVDVLGDDLIHPERDGASADVLNAAVPEDPHGLVGAVEETRGLMQQGKQTYVRQTLGHSWHRTPETIEIIELVTVNKIVTILVNSKKTQSSLVKCMLVCLISI